LPFDCPIRETRASDQPPAVAGGAKRTASKRQDGKRHRRGRARHVGGIQSGDSLDWTCRSHGAPPNFVRSGRGYAARPRLENDKREIQVLDQDLDRRIVCFQSRWVPRASSRVRGRRSPDAAQRPEIGVEAVGWAVASNTRDLSQPAKFRRRGRRRERQGDMSSWK
jgi:hypothetical protein